MNPAVTESLKRIASTQIKFAQGLASSHGQDVSDELTDAWQSLISALETEPKPEPGIFGERLFAPKKKTKKP